jgi:hypothetical protein
MEAGNPSDEELWQACKKLPSDWEPHGQRKLHRKRQDRPDCDTCRWFAELFRTSPDWGACSNPKSPRGGLLTNREQSCWQHEPVKERRYQATRPAHCDFMLGFEAFLREQAAAFIKEEVRRVNDPFPADEPPAATPGNILETALVAVIHRLLKHAEEDFRRPAFVGMATRARKDTRRYWEAARRFWARNTGAEMPEIRLPENMREMENEFWQHVDAAIKEALEGTSDKSQKEVGRMPTNGEVEKTERYPLIVSTGGGLTIGVYLLIPEGIEYEHPGFVLPKTLPEFLAKYPDKFREMTALAAKRFGFSHSDDSLDDMAHEIVKTFLMFREEGLEDIVAMYISASPRLPGQSLADHFFSYMQMRTDALFPVLGFDNEH